MNRLHLDSQELIGLMSDRTKIIGQGSYGIFIQYNEETLIKIYYKKIFDGFQYLDEKKLINEIDICKSVDQEMLKMFPERIESLKREKRKFEILDSIGLVKAMVLCNDYEIGILLHYYREYMCIDKVFEELQSSEKSIVLNKIKQYLNYLISIDIYPRDLKENNIMIRKKI